MKNALILFLALAMLVSQVSAATVFERSFQEMGYNDFELQGAQKSGCTGIKFVFPEEVEFLTGENNVIVSLNMGLFPIKGKNFYVEVRPNLRETGTYTTENLVCAETCWLRATLPKETLKEGENELDICLNNSVDVTKSVLYNKSTVGVYKTANFSAEDSFIEIAEKENLVLGEKTKITLLLHNKGGDSANVELKHARPLAEYKDAYVVVEGSTQFSGKINAGETVRVEYTIKPEVIGSISLPPAILYYDNEFGEKQQKFAKMTTIRVAEPEVKVNAFVIKEKEINKAGDTVSGRIAVKNEGQDTLSNLRVYIDIAEGLSLIEEPGTLIDTLQPGETKYLEFNARAVLPGEYAIGCKVSYSALGAKETNCNKSTFIFEKPEIPLDLFAGLLLVGIAIVTYLFIQFSK